MTSASGHRRGQDYNALASSIVLSLRPRPEDAPITDRRGFVAAPQTEGVDKASEPLAEAAARPEGPVDPDLVKELAFLLFSIAETNSWTTDALAFNTLATSWPDVFSAARSVPAQSGPVQGAFDFRIGSPAAWSRTSSTSACSPGAEPNRSTTCLRPRSRHESNVPSPGPWGRPASLALTRSQHSRPSGRSGGRSPGAARFRSSRYHAAGDD